MRKTTGIDWKPNATPYILEILKKQLQKRYNSRDRKGTHVSDSIPCPRLTVFRKLLPKQSTTDREMLFFLRGEYIHQGIQGLLKEYNHGRFLIEAPHTFTGKDIHTSTGREKEYTTHATLDVDDTLLNYIIDIKSMNKEEMLYGPNESHLNQLAYYMAITGMRKGQLLYVLLTNKDENPFRAFDVIITDKYREQTRTRLVKETRDIEDSVELNDPTLARHVRFDSRYNWKCQYCPYKMECDEYLKKEINLPINSRKWWDKSYNGKCRTLEVPKRWTKKKVS